MKKIVTVLFTASIIAQGAFSQTKTYPIRPQALGVNFILNDFTTPYNIRTTSLASTINKKTYAKFSSMSPGLQLTYYKGLSPFVDFAGSLAGSFVQSNYVVKNASSDDQKFLMEADASLQAKLLPETYWVTPFASGGFGLSEFASHYGAFIPLGLGLKVNLFDEAAITIGSQYRIPVTTNTNGYHLMYSIGISGLIGK